MDVQFFHLPSVTVYNSDLKKQIVRVKYTAEFKMTAIAREKVERTDGRPDPNQRYLIIRINTQLICDTSSHRTS